ncbi:hypothetical protein [Actinomadura xylanilytica]|uniref:hypothetical protein n=1 Tax=Actinomadura xylanilytica TaxID=887459 RepID=UPI00255ACE82|nr:hypothetical protein [Actinomadura xylanilytica]MDL4772507.1 hypothetical protein [Actinomadura xylanilytica]
MISDSTPNPWELTWADVDPARHPFAVERVAATIDGVPAGRADDETLALVRRFGPWACAWDWTRGFSGGPVTVWCCTSHRPPGMTHAEMVEAALVDWRTWLETLAARFDALALPAGSPRERSAAWERAVTTLVTDVVERTGAADAWYVHCEQVLAWFLTHQGVPKDRRAALLTKAIGGRFSSWVGPDPELVTDLGRRIAAAAQQATRDRGTST